MPAANGLRRRNEYAVEGVATDDTAKGLHTCTPTWPPDVARLAS
jgi:hypothetical protein